MFTETVLTVSEGKRLIAKGVAKHPDVLKALSEGTVVICKGTTNAYVVEELLGRPIKRTDYVTGKTVPKLLEGKPITSASLPDVRRKLEDLGFSQYLVKKERTETPRILGQNIVLPIARAADAPP